MQIAALLSITLASATAQGPAAPFEVGLWPGEGRPVFEAVATELPLREQPSATVPIVERLRVTKGHKVEFGQTVYRTLTPGRLRVLTETRLLGRRLGTLSRLSKDDYYSGKFSRGELVVRAGEVVEYLQYRAEGTCFIRVDGAVLDAEACPAQNAQAFAVESKPELEWWIEVLAGGKPSGWLMVDAATVKEVRRTFQPEASSLTKYEGTGRGGKGRELLQRGQFTRVVLPGPEAPPRFEE